MRALVVAELEISEIRDATNKAGVLGSDRLKQAYSRKMENEGRVSGQGRG
jgi:hypothetical protein